VCVIHTRKTTRIHHRIKISNTLSMFPQFVGPSATSAVLIPHVCVVGRLCPRSLAEQEIKSATARVERRAGCHGSDVKAKPMRNTDWTPAHTTISSRSTAARPSDRTQAPFSDEAAHLDSMLIAELATVNTLIAKYILRSTGVDDRETAEISLADERSLADLLASAADGLRARVSRRERNHER